MKESFDWTLQTIELLSELLGVLSKMVKAWDTFSSCGGDIGYFSDIDASPNISTYACRSLRAIKEAFEKLEDHRQRLLLLKERCYGFARAVSYNPFPLLMTNFSLGNEVR